MLLTRKTTYRIHLSIQYWDMLSLVLLDYIYRFDLYSYCWRCKSIMIFWWTYKIFLFSNAKEEKHETFQKHYLFSSSVFVSSKPLQLFCFFHFAYLLWHAATFCNSIFLVPNVFVFPFQPLFHAAFRWWVFINNKSVSKLIDLDVLSENFVRLRLSTFAKFQNFASMKIDGQGKSISESRNVYMASSAVKRRFVW